MRSLKRVLPVLPLALASVAAAQPQQSMPGANVIGGCVQGFVQPSLSALTRDLNQARVRWQRAGIRSYTYTFDEISQPVRFPRTQVTVTGGVVQVAALEEGQPSAFAQRASVEHLFNAIREAISDARREPCTELKVGYAPDGHPLSFSNTQHKMNVMDGGASWTVADFRRR